MWKKAFEIWSKANNEMLSTDFLTPEDIEQIFKAGYDYKKEINNGNYTMPEM